MTSGPARATRSLPADRRDGRGRRLAAPTRRGAPSGSRRSCAGSTTYLPASTSSPTRNGRDLVSGADRSGLLKRATSHRGPPRLARRPPHPHPWARRTDGSRYRFISIVRPWFDPPNILPYYGAIVLVIVGMGAILAAHLAAPLRRLRRVVDRFGRGDLSSGRFGSEGRDRRAVPGLRRDGGADRDPADRRAAAAPGRLARAALAADAARRRRRPGQHERRPRANSWAASGATSAGSPSSSTSCSS